MQTTNPLNKFEVYDVSFELLQHIVRERPGRYKCLLMHSNRFGQEYREQSQCNCEAFGDIKLPVPILSTDLD